MSKFLEDLKNAADNGQFNSDAAKKILEINELADSKIGAGKQEDLDRLKESLEKRQNEVVPEEKQEKAIEAVEEIEELENVKEVEEIGEEKVAEAYTEYEKKMAMFKKQDTINAQIATLTEVEDMVKLTITDMFDFVTTLETTFEKEIEAKDPMLAELILKINSIKATYLSIIN